MSQQHSTAVGPDTPVEPPAGKCVHQLFEEQVGRTPDAVALVFEDQEWTYRELNERANQLANHLRNLGVEPETLVGLCMERSLELIVSILGVLKAGAAYLPLDPDDPIQRLESKLTDASVKFVIAGQRWLNRLPNQLAHVICFETDAAVLQDANRSNPALNVTPDHLAYVMFTSGSQGQPKGVMIQHASIVRLVFGNTYAAFGSDRVFLQLAPTSFDASTFEIWGALLHGARLVIAPPGLPDFPRWEALLKRHRVTTLWLTAALFNQVIEQYPQALSEVEEILTGGEALSVRHIVKAQQALGTRVQLINGYGPTECTTFAVCYRIPNPLPAESTSIPIGRPIANTEAYVLGEHGRTAPIGIAGELWLGGVGLARGYLNHPELTAEKFLPHPFSDDPEASLYSTGDQCRWRADGNLEFLGRLDDQVKLRGYRIELGEIESVLNRHPALASCVVVLREDRPEDKRLVAYCVAAQDATIETGELSGYLRARLPEYMVPSLFLILDALPLTANGKVDRRALPVPGNERPGLRSQFVAPRNHLEEQLAGIWRQVLGVDRVGIHDDFFDLGGHSLLAIKIAVRIRESLGADIAIRAVFDAPTLAALAEHVVARKGTEVSSAPLKRLDREQIDRLPLSFAQQRLWFLEQMEGELTAYNLPFAWRLHGPLNIEALRRAIELLLLRHEALRTTFKALEGEPVQLIRSINRFELPVEDLQGMGPVRHPAEIEKRRSTEAERPFDLSSDLMLRASLLRLAEDEHVLLLTLHHIAADGWSVFVVLMKELGALYDAACRGDLSGLPALPVQYADYALWQREQLKDKQLDKLLGYWRQNLDGVAVLELPTDRPRPREQTYRGNRHEFALDAELIQLLKRLGQSEGATLHMTLLAAFVTLISRYSSQDDVAVGTVTAGRNHPVLEGLIGFFVNTLVIRTDLSGDPTFREVLARVRKVSLDAYDHQDLPFEKLVAELQPERHLGRSPIIQVLFQLLNFADHGLALRGLDVSSLPHSDERVRFDLEMYVWQPVTEEESHRVTLVYSTDLFDADRIMRLEGHFVTLLRGIVADANQRLSSLPLLTEAERHQLLVEWNDTSVDYPHDKCVHQLFEEQVERTPDTIAVECEGQEVSYRALNERANQLAHHLRSLGVGPESVVGLYMERSLEQTIAILGVLKSGGAYLPLDAESPSQRLMLMLQNGNVRHLLTQQHMRHRLPANDSQVICMDHDVEKRNALSLANPAVSVAPGNLAYVMYTSGSTGTPKGVEMPHRALVNLIDWHRRDRRLSQPARTLQFASSHFDVSFQEMLTTWSLGGTLILVSEVVRRDPQALWKLIVDAHVQRLFLPYVVLQQLTAFARGTKAQLRDIVCAGEPLQLTPGIRELVQSLDDCRLHNQYGPTESHVVTTHLLERDVAAWPNEASIGKPISNTQIYVLDDHGQPVPVGVHGELHIGGIALARGYLNRPELTAEKFVPNPFADDPELRLYKTGDMCCWLVNGTLEFLGRADRQVKLRGFRIELGEIEAVLNEHPRMKQCVVMLREDRKDDKRLVAYCIPVEDAAFDIADLTAHLRVRLPEYMIPSAFVRMQKFPSTTTGKIDRRSLPAPDQTRPDRAGQYVAPRNPLEEQLASIWSQVLGVSRVGIHDNFFDLGGHSLLAVQLAAWIAAALEVALPIRKLFESPTIAELAVVVRIMQAGPTPSLGPPLKRFDRERNQRLPLSFAQQRLWLIDQMEVERAAYNLPFAWRLQGRIHTEALRQAIEVLVKRHEPLRTTFVAAGKEPAQVVQEIDHFELPIEDLRNVDVEQQPEEVRERCKAEAEKSFDLATDLMIRATLLQLSDVDHVLLLTVHHIAFDGWSLGVFARELAQLYASYSGGKRFDLPALPVQYADYALWQRAWLQGETLQQQLAYWKEHLAGAPPVLELPSDFPRPAMQRFRGAQHEFSLDRFLSKSLQELSRKEGVTLFMTMLAAWQVLLMRYSGQQDIVVGVPVAGRNRARLDGLIGFFVNTLALRTDLSGNPSFQELLHRVRKVALGAFAHQDLPFEKLVEELQPERSLSHHPLLQVLLVLQNAPTEELKLGEVSVTPMDIGSVTAKFDLTLSLQEDASGIQGSLAFKTDLFEAKTIARLADHFTTLLKAIVSNPRKAIAELSLLMESERHQLLVEWNDTSVDYPHDKCVHQLFEEQVERTPDAVALVMEQQTLTYRELNERANQLARYLQTLGVGPETHVGLCLQRSTEMVVGILGILKAGGAYLPLDPDDPPQRLQYMLSEAKAGYLVTQQRWLNRFPDTCYRTTCLDTQAMEFGVQEKSNPLPIVNSNNLAYVMFTSGSTGCPKGVMIQHSSIARLVMGNDYAAFGPDRVFLQLAPVSFDASTFELWGALLHGSRLVIAPPGLPDFDRLESLLKRHRVTTLWLTAALFNQVIEQHPQALSEVQEVLTGGEALSVRHIVKAQQLLGPHVQLINGYGPTESTTFAVCYRIPASVPAEADSIPIGRPIANTQAFVLDEHQQPVPIGVPGELYLGGVGLARGYLNHPEWTQEKFVQNTAISSSRLYRTGDQCRWRADGQLDFLGRLDNQVKLRGFRIEPGEIETVLNAHPSVKQSLVLMREDRPGDKRLVAYCVPVENASLDFAALTDHLRLRLPEHMIPSAFASLPSLPLTSTGKVDRHSLPAPDQPRPDWTSQYIAPRNSLEEQLASIWCQVLGVQRVGIHDNFFDLGGHSLLAIQLFARIQQSFGQKLPIAVLFQHGTINHLARLLSDSNPETEFATVLPIQSEGDGRTLFLMPGITGEAMLSRIVIEKLGNRFPIMGIQPNLACNHVEQFKSIRTTASHIVPALRRHQPHGPYALVGFSYGGMLAYEVGCLLSESGEKVDLLVVIDTGPGQRHQKPRMWDRWKGLAGIVSNLPNWVREEYRQFSVRNVVDRLGRKMRRFFRVLTTSGKVGLKMDDILDVSRIPSQNRDLLQTALDAFFQYQPGYFSGKLTLFRAKTQPLVTDFSEDLGWRQYAKTVDIRQINGNHETILHPPHVDQLASQLIEMMERLKNQ